MRIIDATLLALEATGGGLSDADEDAWRRAAAEGRVGPLETIWPEKTPSRALAPEPPPLSGGESAAPQPAAPFPEKLARLTSTLLLPSAKALDELSPSVFSGGRRCCLYGLGDALSIGWDSAFRRLESLSASSGALLTPCFTNERGCATALTVEWLLGRAERAAVVSFAGCGGLAALEEVLAALRVYGALPDADLAALPKLAALYSRLGGAPISPVKAVIGEAVFYVEAGIHVDGLGKSPDLYEPFPPESVGRERRIVMGKHSSRRSVLAKCAALDLPMTEALAGRLLKRLKEESVKRGASLHDEDFINLYSTCRAGRDERKESSHAAL